MLESIGVGRRVSHNVYRRNSDNSNEPAAKFARKLLVVIGWNRRLSRIAAKQKAPRSFDPPAWYWETGELKDFSPSSAPSWWNIGRKILRDRYEKPGQIMEFGKKPGIFRDSEWDARVVDKIQKVFISFAAIPRKKTKTMLRSAPVSSD